MSFELLCSEFDLANVIILAFKNQVTCNIDCPYYSHVKKILKNLIKKLNMFIIKLYRLKRKSCANFESLHKNVKNCLSLFEKFARNLKTGIIKALPHFYEHIIQLTEKYAKLLMFQSRFSYSLMVECERKLAIFLKGLLSTHTLIQITHFTHTPVILIRLLVNSEKCSVPEQSQPESQQQHNSDVLCQNYKKSDSPENFEDFVKPFSVAVPETPPKCQRHLVCDEVATVRENTPLLMRHLFPGLYPSRHCQTLSTHYVIQRKSPKRPFPTVFMVTDSHCSHPKKLKNDNTAGRTI